MRTPLIDELKSLLQASDAKLRKHWAERIVNENIPVASLMILLHGHKKTAQRFTWLIGDLLDADRSVVADCLPMLFELRNKMPFPGMRRTVAKCLWYLDVPAEMEDETTTQLVKWLDDDKYSIGCKHYAAKALFDLAKQNCFSAKELDAMLDRQTKHANMAHAGRMKKMRQQLAKLN